MSNRLPHRFERTPHFEVDSKLFDERQLRRLHEAQPERNIQPSIHFDEQPKQFAYVV